MSDTTTGCHAGYCPGCGNMVAVGVDDGSSHHAKFVARMIKDRLRVERVTVAVARASLQFCDCKPKKQKDTAKQEALAL